MKTRATGRDIGVLATWAVFALLALFWTAGAGLAALFAQWAAGALASGAAVEAGRSLATMPVPPWVAIWAGPEWVEALQASITWALDAAQSALPFVGSLAAWLVPLVWVAWGFGLVVMLVAAGGAHLLLRRVGVSAAVPMSRP